MGCLGVIAFILVCGGLLSLRERIPSEASVFVMVAAVVLFFPIICIIYKDTFIPKKKTAVGERTKTNQNSAECSCYSIDPVKLEPYKYEKYVADYLIEHGYKSAQVTQQSSDYGIDIVAENLEGWKIAIQCKRYQGSVGVAAIQEVIAGKEYYGCDLAAVYTTGTYTEHAKHMAQKTHVKLYVLDKNGLKIIN